LNAARRLDAAERIVARIKLYGSLCLHYCSQGLHRLAFENFIIFQILGFFHKLTDFGPIRTWHHDCAYVSSRRL
jgi:hypothetical protein